MKKVLLTLVAACLVFVASAQFSGGLKAGLNFATFGADAENTEILTSFHVGAFGQFALSDKLTLQPELLYNAVGEGSTEWKMNYISIPVMFLYNINEQFNIQAGPQLGLLMSAEIDGTDVKEEMSGTDFGINFGVGAGFGKLSVSARYSLGLSNILDTEALGDIKLTNNVIQLSVGYKLFGE